MILALHAGLGRERTRRLLVEVIYITLALNVVQLSRDLFIVSVAKLADLNLSWFAR